MSVYEGGLPLPERFRHFRIDVAKLLAIADVQHAPQFVQQRETRALSDGKTKLHAREQIERQNLIHLPEERFDSLSSKSRDRDTGSMGAGGNVAARSSVALGQT